MRGRAGWGGKKLLFLLYYLFSILGFESSLEVIIGNMLLNAIILTKVFFQYFFWVGIYVISIFHFLRFFFKFFMCITCLFIIIIIFIVIFIFYYLIMFKLILKLLLICEIFTNYLFIVSNKIVKIFLLRCDYFFSFI